MGVGQSRESNDGRPVIDPSGPVRGPVHCLVGDGRLELRSSRRVFARELLASETLSLYGVVDGVAVQSVCNLQLGASGLADGLALESPPNFNRAQALSLHQYLVPQTQFSAKAAVMGDEGATCGIGCIKAALGESCQIKPATLHALDVKVLEDPVVFGDGRQMLRVPAGTSVEVVSEHRALGSGTRGPSGGGCGDWCDGEIF